MDKNNPEETALDALFAAERAIGEQPSDDFMSRLSADVASSVPGPVVSSSKPAPALRYLRRWFAASGLSGAAVLGVWIGFVMPEAITEFTALSDDTVGLYTFLPGADLTAPGTSE